MMQRCLQCTRGRLKSLIIDKSGYVRWKFPTDADGLAQPTIGEAIESELEKLKRG